jgi:hypothetical protein
MQQKAEYAKQYRLKRKLSMQQRASISSETDSAPSKRRYGGAYEKEDDELYDLIVVQPNKNNYVYLPSLVMKVPDHLYVLGDTYTCHMLTFWQRSFTFKF